MENQSSSTPSSMQFLLLEQVQFLKVNDDSLLQWELVNVVDAEEEIDAFGSWDSSISCSESESSPNNAPIEEIRHLLLHPVAALQDLHNHYLRDDVDHESKQESDGDDDDEDDDNDEDDDGYGLDDELVPWNVSNKFGRQRMRKLGKRAFSKMHNSKKSPYLFVRPGCVRGKHGLGLKHITDS